MKLDCQPCLWTSASFEHVQISRPSPLTIKFTDFSTNANSWEWDFGDSGIFHLQHIIHTWGNPGTYKVCLTVSNECSTDSTCININVFHTGIGSTSSSQVKFNISPNPTSGKFRISFPAKPGTDLTISVFNVLGVEVMHQDFAPSQVAELNGEGLEAGIYIVRVRMGGLEGVGRLLVGGGN